MVGKDLMMATLFGSGGGSSGSGGEEGSTTGIDALIVRTITEVKSDVETVGVHAFYGCNKLTTANFPVATNIGNDAFCDCAKLTTTNFPAVTNISYNAFSGCYGLTTANFPVVTNIGSSAFSNAVRMTAFILRSETLCTLSNTNAFYNCYHMLGTTNKTYNPDGLHDGYVYVPSALVAEYQAATNWSSLALQFRALEDYTVDGTITGELDESKI